MSCEKPASALAFLRHLGRRLLVPPLLQLQGDYVPAVILHDVDVGLPALEPDVELVDMPYPGVLRPVPALEHLEAVVRAQADSIIMSF